MRDVKLLLVEDDEDDYVLAKDLLDQIAPGHYTLDWAPSAAVAREILQHNAHDLCLMDYRLGSDDGIQLLRQAPRLGYEGPIIMLTGQDDSTLDAEALKAGAVDYLVKADLDAPHLARAIRYALARREMEVERLERLRAEAENRSKSEFLAHLSHELRTPLTAILGYTDLLISRHDNDESRSQLQIVKRNGSHLLSLLNDVLDLSKIEAGHLEIELQDLELGPFLADIHSLMNMAAKDKSLELKFDTDRELPQRIRTDPTRLRQILLNLLGNAIKFTEQGSVELEVHVVEQSSETLIEFVVKDSGIGISAVDLEKIFQPFGQAHHQSHEQRGGTGLGLTISQQLARWLGGDIQVMSTPGIGSSFHVTVHPGDIENVDCERLPLVHGVTAGPIHQHNLEGRVLVVDDLADIRELVGHLIEQSGAEVEYACDGEEAVTKAMAADQEGKPFHLIVMDVQMPVLNGHQATRALRSRGYSRPILALTAATMKGEKERCVASGFNDHMSKPVDANKLLKAIGRLIPQAENKQTAGTASTAEPVQPIAKHEDKVGRVLLVEDNPDARAATSALIALLGWEVDVAESGEQARSRVADSQPTIVLLDINLPDTDGYSLASRLRQEGLSDARIIALTGAAIDTEKAQSAGIDGHLLKPVGAAALDEVLGRPTSKLEPMA